MTMQKAGAGELQAPYLRRERTTAGIMGDVCIALIPGILGGAYYFGSRVLALTAVSVAVCVLTEYLWQRLTKAPVTAEDFSAVVTGMLLAMNFPVTVPWPVLAAAGVFAVLAAKQFMGGIGTNFANPALVGRLFVMLVWPGKIMQYVLPGSGGADAVTSATALSIKKGGGVVPYSYWEMFAGDIPGAMGETCKLLLLAGFFYLCYKEVVNAEAALIYTGTVALAVWVLGPEGWFTGDALAAVLSGGLILGACFMLTDYMFVSRKGKALYAVTAGVLTALFRLYSPYPEGVCFGILTANCLSGALAGFYRQHVYGVFDKKSLP